jgi:hypothetical protein
VLCGVAAAQGAAGVEGRRGGLKLHAARCGSPPRARARPEDGMEKVLLTVRGAADVLSVSQLRVYS